MMYCRSSSSVKTISSKDGTDIVPGDTEGQLYENADEFVNSGLENFELSQCPAYESTTSKPHPQQTEAQNSYYEL